MENDITHLRQYGPVNTEQLFAIIAHFGTCDNVVIDNDIAETTWTGDKETVNGKQFHATFITAAIEHVTTCQAAQTEFAHLIDTSATRETIMTGTTGPEPQPIAITALNLSDTGPLEGVILTAVHDNVTHRYDLIQVVERVPRMQFRRYDTARLTSIIPVSPASQSLDIGAEVSLYGITGNGQYLVIGDHAYDYSTVKEFLRTHGSKLELSSDDYTPPAWAIQQSASQQGRHDTGLTELPASASEDPEYYDREIDTDDTDPDELERTEYLIERDGIWPSLRRYWIVTTLGLIAGIFTAGTITVAAHHHFTMIWSVVIGLVTSVSITCGAGVLGSLVAGRTFIEPELTSDEYQAWVLHGGAIVGWMLLVLTDLAFLF